MSKQKIKFYEVNENKTIYKLKKNSYIKIKTLGEGSFGKVILVKEENQRDKSNSKYFAIKISKKFELVSEKNDTDINGEKQDKEKKPIELNFSEIRELIIMKKIEHPNVINLIDYKLCNEDREVLILMDYMPTNLSQFLAMNITNPNVMNEKFFKNIANQLLEGINYLHQKRIIHRDLKPENILYDEKNNIARIGDFGLSRQLDYDTNRQYTDVGTFPYKPPELILGCRNYSTAFDIWSLGCIFVEIVTNSNLFGENNDLGVIKLMVNIFGSFDETLLLSGNKLFSKLCLLKKIQKCKGIGLVNYIKSKKLFDFENDQFYDLIEKMLCIDPTKRISAQECLSHPWFSDKK